MLISLSHTHATFQVNLGYPVVHLDFPSKICFIINKCFTAFVDQIKYKMRFDKQFIMWVWNANFNKNYHINKYITKLLSMKLSVINYL